MFIVIELVESLSDVHKMSCHDRWFIFICCLEYDPAILDALGLPTPWEHDVLDRMLPHIVNCHLHDNDGTDDQHLLPGDGTLDWTAVAALLPWFTPLSTRSGFSG